MFVALRHQNLDFNGVNPRRNVSNLKCMDQSIILIKLSQRVQKQDVPDENAISYEKMRLDSQLPPTPACFFSSEGSEAK
jgi:hypothetical protein